MSMIEYDEYKQKLLAQKPVLEELKQALNIDAAREENVRKEVEGCLRSHGISPTIHEGLHSGGGKYRTLKVPVTLLDRGMMDSLSADLAKIEGVKFLL